MKKALLFSPYLDTVGGGEYYLFSLAKLLLNNNYEVTVAWKDNKPVKWAKDRFGLDIKKIIFDKKAYGLFISKGKFWQKFLLQKNFDLFFFLSDGSVPFIFSKNNILHFQVPFSGLRESGLTRLKIKQINKIVVNSEFTKKIIDRQLKVKSQVIYPPVEVHKNIFKKEKIILSVGRFDEKLNSKRHDVLIKAFKKLADGGVKGWSLILAGGAKDIRQKELLKKQIGNYNIKLKINLKRDALEKLYQRASIYWHAAGFEINEEINPERVEHFGITVVEARSFGCIPIVIKKGGIKEIVKNGKNGYLWERESELVEFTKKVINDKKLAARLSEQSRKNLDVFSFKEFDEKFKQII